MAATRFARIRTEKRHLYVTKAIELFNLHFLTNGNLNVTSLIFAGCADFKYDLAKRLNKNINDKIIGFFDIQHNNRIIQTFIG